MEQHHPIMDKLGGLGGRTYRQTDRQSYSCEFMNRDNVAGIITSYKLRTVYGMYLGIIKKNVLVHFIRAKNGIFLDLKDG